jgi:hypothetical protein
MHYVCVCFFFELLEILKKFYSQQEKNGSTKNPYFGILKKKFINTQRTYIQTFSLTCFFNPKTLNLKMHYVCVCVFCWNFGDFKKILFSTRKKWICKKK